MAASSHRFIFIVWICTIVWGLIMVRVRIIIRVMIRVWVRVWVRVRVRMMIYFCAEAC